VPVPFRGLTGVAAIAGGGEHTCVLTTAGGVECWGHNHLGDLGDGTTNDRLSPVPAIGLSSGVQEIAAGSHHTCALTVAGAVECWGWNEEGQLGDGTDTNRLVPVQVVGLASGVRQIAAYVEHTCALADAGGVKCWGENASGELGDGTTTARSTPGPVVGLEIPISVLAIGAEHTCAVTTANGLECWGRNSEGELGEERGPTA
jgi:alpha-tubulin suppressor-like RCC1 family protein